MPGFKGWTDGQGIKTLWDISNSENEPPYRWDGWTIPEFPAEIEGEKKQFLDYLSGSALVARRKRDKRGCGSCTGLYTTDQGYNVFSSIPSASINPEIWKKLWKTITLPKIDIFCWTLVHGNILKGEHLEKRGIEGPFICPLCCENNETILCNYPKTVWSMLTEPWFGKVEIPGNVQQCFTNWEKPFKGDLNNKK